MTIYTRFYNFLYMYIVLYILSYLKCIILVLYTLQNLIRYYFFFVFWLLNMNIITCYCNINYIFTICTLYSMLFLHKTIKNYYNLIRIHFCILFFIYFLLKQNMMVGRDVERYLLKFQFFVFENDLLWVVRS